MRRQGLYHWIVNHLNYRQTYILVCTIFSLALLPLGYFWIKNHFAYLNVINLELEKVQQKILLKNIFEKLEKHRLFQSQLFNQPEDITLITEIDNLQKQITQLNQKTNYLPTINQLKNTFYYQIYHQTFEPKWNAVKNRSTSLSVDKNYQLHTTLLNELKIQFDYLNDYVNDAHAKQIDRDYVLNNLNKRLPTIQENIARLGLLGEQAIRSNFQDFKVNEMALLADAVDIDLTYFKVYLDFHPINASNHEKKYSLEKLLSNFVTAAKNFISLTQNKLIYHTHPSISLDTFINQFEDVWSMGSQLWDKALSDLNQIIHQDRKNWILEMWLIPLITLLTVATSFAIGLGITYNATRRLSELTRTTDSFTNGDLSVRLPVAYQDEVGKQATAFNRMAQKFQEIVNHLHELIDATTALANGNYSIRIQPKDESNEFKQVALSFNKMADNFEAIINRLHQLGVTLTSSATEIASASKEQETIIVEQEAATREIAIAANEISSTSKEFAHTMNDISQAAEQTSTLASKGREALNNMEAAMRQMVEASSSITARLGILNDKATNITTVITTITKVADQTNLLSLNASIEAEKAGEYGRSFAVIAREIRHLADQTAVATLDIEKIVNEIMTAISSSVMGVDDFTQEIRRGVGQVNLVSNQLATIISQVQDFVNRFDFVNQGMQAQSMGAEQINEAITQLSQTAQQTSESIHQFHRTIEELNAAAKELHLLIPAVSEDSHR